MLAAAADAALDAVTHGATGAVDVLEASGAGGAASLRPLAAIARTTRSFTRHARLVHFGTAARRRAPVRDAALHRLTLLVAYREVLAARRGGEFPVGEIGRFIDGRFAPAAHGTREMPVWGERFGERVPDAGISEEVTRGNIAVLIEYLKSIQEPARNE